MCYEFIMFILGTIYGGFLVWCVMTEKFKTVQEEKHHILFSFEQVLKLSKECNKTNEVFNQIINRYSESNRRIISIAIKKGDYDTIISEAEKSICFERDKTDELENELKVGENNG